MTVEIETKTPPTRFERDHAVGTSGRLEVDGRGLEPALRATARRCGAPIFARGGGTGIPGQTCNNGLLFDLSKYMSSALWVDPTRKPARVEPGVVVDSLRNAAEPHRLTFGPDPATHNRCALGGMLGNDSCGIYSVVAGRTVDNVEDLEVVTLVPSGSEGRNEVEAA
jgi:FAD/FMN-containing dehydrogenase